MEEAMEEMRKTFAEGFPGAQGSMAELKSESEFTGQLGKKKYPKAKAPESKQILRWDFSKKHKFVYDYEQKVKMGAGRGGGTSMEATGTLSMNAKGDKTANMVLRDMSMRMGGVAPAMKQPAVVFPGVTEDSKMPDAGPSQSEMVKMLFPLPADPISVGESSTIPSKMPFNAYGSPLFARGSTTITLTGYVTIKGHVCAVLDVSVDISELDVPEEMTGEYKCLTKGKGTLYFDTRDRCFHSGEVAAVMSFSIDPGPDSQNPMAMPVSMSSDNFLRFTRNREKEKDANEK